MPATSAAAGFEHCLAKAYLIPLGLYIKTGADEAFWNSIGNTTANFPGLT